jgi:hypothetical protein
MIERYSLQEINLHQFLVREDQRKESGQDHIVRTLERPEDACSYVGCYQYRTASPWREV